MRFCLARRSPAAGTPISSCQVRANRSSIDARVRATIRYASPRGRVNDDSTLRAEGSAMDAYVVFQKMLNSGAPSDNRIELLNSAAELKAQRRLKGSATARDK
jgi:hypothetical protein